MPIDMVMTAIVDLLSNGFVTVIREPAGRPAGRMIPSGRPAGHRFLEPSWKLPKDGYRIKYGSYTHIPPELA